MPLPFKALCVFVCCSSSVSAATITFSVKDNQDQPLNNAVISLVPISQGALQIASTAQAATANMTQQDKQFNPHVVAVQRGQQVQFPNNDSIKHQVYSLSELQQFDLVVEPGENQNGPEMSSSGAVNIGCNIHDWMQAYIYVVDSPWFATSDYNGRLSIEIPDNETFRWQLWHPRASESDNNLSGSVSAPYSDISISLDSDLLPAYDEVADFDDFDDY